MAPGIVSVGIDERRPSTTSLGSNNHLGLNGINGNHLGNGMNGYAAGRSRHRDPVAIVGMSAKFGGTANDTSGLWDMVAGGKSAWSPIPKDRFDVKSFYHADKDRPGRVRS